MLSLLLGPAGSGKSSFCAQWPDPQFIIDNQDEGLIDLVYEQQVPISLDAITQCADYNAYKSALTAAKRSHRKTIVCESVRGLQAMCMDYSSTRDHDGDRSHKSFLNFQTGPITAIESLFNDIITLMMELQSLGKHVWFVGHTKTATITHIEGADYKAARIAAEDRTDLILQTRFMNVFVLADHLNVIGKPKAIGKVGSDSTRWMYPHANPRYPSKNRMGLVCEFKFPSNAKEAYVEFCIQTKRDPRTGYRRAG